VIFVLAEALPKNWAVYNPDRSALFAAPIVSLLVRFPPVRLISNGLNSLAALLVGPRHRRSQAVSESELLALADVAEEEAVIETQERELIHSIIDFGDTIAREVMVPRPDMRAVEADASASDALGVAMEAGFSRMPVYDGNLDDVVGVAHAKDLVRAERAGNGGRSVRDVARPAHFVPETKRAARLMREMQEKKFHMAIVVDEYGGIAGLVTIEDVIEQIIGDIADEFDVEDDQGIRREGERQFSVRGSTRIDEFNQYFEADLPTDEFDTVAGLVMKQLGRMPRRGETLMIGIFEFRVVRTDRRRIESLRVTIPPQFHSAAIAE